MKSNSTSKIGIKHKGKITEIDDDKCGIYEILLKSRYYKGTGKNVELVGGIKDLIGLWVNKDGVDIISALLKIIRSEYEILTPIMNTPKNKSERILRIIPTRFSEDISKEGDLEAALIKKIDQLKKHEYTVSLEKKYSLEQVIQLITSLRKNRISFYKEILAEYRANKEFYEKEIQKMHFYDEKQNKS